MILYDENKKLFNKYVLNNKNMINNLIINKYDLQEGYHIYHDLLNNGLINVSDSISDAIKVHRLKMIDVKQAHTFRVANNIDKICEKINVCDDFVDLAKLSALFHDIARFPQAVTTNSFQDKDCVLFNGLSHAEYGYKMLYVNKMIEDYNIPKEYYYVLALTVLYHQTNKILCFSFDDINELNTNLLTGNNILKKEEFIITSTLVQLIRDVDKIDILYQHLIGDYPVINPSIKCRVNGKTLDDICKKYNIDKKIVKEYNNLISDNICALSSISIPSNYIDISTLIVPNDIKNSFFKNEMLDLRKLQSRDDYTFIVGMWWRLNHFLNDINFVANLENIKENEVLDKIYKQYPLRYRVLVSEAFEFAKEKLLCKRIEENKGKIFVKR